MTKDEVIQKFQFQILMGEIKPVADARFTTTLYRLFDGTNCRHRWQMLAGQTNGFMTDGKIIYCRYCLILVNRWIFASSENTGYHYDVLFNPLESAR